MDKLRLTDELKPVAGEIGEIEMTDLEKFIDLYKSVGIDLIPDREDEGLFLNLMEGKHKELVGGYMGFFTAIHFDFSGKFITQGAWE